MKKASVFAVALLIAFALVSCGPSQVEGGGNESQAEGQAEMSMLQSIIDSGTLKAGIALTGPPIGMRDNTGEPLGYDVDFAKRMADELGVELEITEVTGETRIPMLTSGRVDIVFANMTGTLARAQSINFSIPYLRVGIKMMVPADSPYTDASELNDPSIRIAVGRGTTGEALAAELAPEAELVYVDDYTQQVLLVRQGRVDATFEDSSLIDFTVGESGGELKAPPRLYTSDPISVGIPKGDMEFVRWVDMFISWQISSGWQADTYEKWWGSRPTARLDSPW